MLKLSSFSFFRYPNPTPYPSIPPLLSYSSSNLPQSMALALLFQFTWLLLAPLLRFAFRLSSLGTPSIFTFSPFSYWVLPFLA